MKSLWLLSILTISISSFSQSTSTMFFQKANDFFYQYVSSSKVNYKEVKNNATDLKELVDIVAMMNLDSLTKNEKKAFYINAYNLLVIQQLVSKYPIKSPLDVAGFFETTKFSIAGKKHTLNAIENDILRKKYSDARLHFVLVCGALGCPVIANYAYNPTELDVQLTKQTKKAVNSSSFIYSDGSDAMISEIFKWYAADFGGSNESTLKFINKYRKNPIPLNSNVKNYPYNWKINEFVGVKNELIKKVDQRVFTEVEDTISNSLKVDTLLTEKTPPFEVDPIAAIHLSEDNLDTNYAQTIEVSENKLESSEIVETLQLESEIVNLQTFNSGSLLAKGKIDLTVFNTIYTQTKSNWMGVNYTGTRETFVTHLMQFTIGVDKNKRINLGLDVNFKSSARSKDSSFRSTWKAFDYKNNDSTRVGISSVGLRAKFSPFKGFNDFTIQSTFYVPTIKNPEGYNNPDGSKKNNLYWSDWNRFISWTQFFYVKTYTRFQFFGEVDLLYRLPTNKKQYTHLDLPVSAIFSYFPTKKWTAYAIAQHTSRYPQNYNPASSTDFVIPANYSTLGLGLKYQPISNLTIELLYTKFVRGKNTGLGNTFNLGIKYLLN
jgi:Protein of unknown function, DUF547